MSCPRAQLCVLLEQRERDHRNWVDALEACVRTGEPFTLARDPHQCAFGRWRDSFQTPDLIVAGFLKRIDRSHGEVHALADKALLLSSKGRVDDALGLLEDARHGVLSEVMVLLTELRSVLRGSLRELAVVLEVGDRTFALAVDSVVGVEVLPRDKFRPLSELPSLGPVTLASCVAERERTHDLVLVLSGNGLLED